MSNDSTNAFRLDDWLVEPDLNRLSRDGTNVALEPKTMEVLVFLRERQGEVVSADDIIDAVWLGRPMGDNPVYKSIAKLRRALGDDSGEPRYIATVPKKGYRLVAAVGPTAPAASAGTGGNKPIVRRVIPVAIGALIGILVAAAVFWRPAASPFVLQSLSGFAGSHGQPSLSPNGDSVAFVNDIDGASNIWTLDFTETAPRQVTRGNRRDSRPRWSPTGETILFVRGGDLWSVPARGGDAREVVRDAYNPNWSPDGTRIVFERRYQVWTADADGGRQQRVSGIPRRELALAPRWPAFSPDGRDIAYLDADATPLADLWRVAVDGGSPEQLTFDAALSSAPVWSPDGKSLVYSSQRGGSRTLWRVQVADKSSRALLTGSGDDDYPDISDDGRRLVYSNSRERFLLLESNPQTGAERVLLESRQMLLGPELSPDRATIAWFSPSRVGGIQVFSMPLAGKTPRQVTADPQATHAIPRWSTDGTALYLFQSREENSYGRVSANGGSVETLVPDWDWNTANGASVSPDGSRVVYSRLTGQVPVQTFIRDLRSDSDESFYATLEYPRWSHDGKWILGARHTDLRFPGDIALCPLAGPDCRILATGARVPQWSPDEKQVYFVRGFGESQDLFRINADGTDGEQHLMTMAPLFPLGPFYDITTSGSIVWIRHDKEPGEIWMTDLPID